MNRYSDVFHSIAATISANRPYLIADWFTLDFRHHDPNLPSWPSGHEGVAATMDRFRTPIRLAALEIVDTRTRSQSAGLWPLQTTAGRYTNPLSRSIASLTAA